MQVGNTPWYWRQRSQGQRRLHRVNGPVEFACEEFYDLGATSEYAPSFKQTALSLAFYEQQLESFCGIARDTLQWINAQQGVILALSPPVIHRPTCQFEPGCRQIAAGQSGRWKTPPAGRAPGALFVPGQA